MFSFENVMYRPKADNASGWYHFYMRWKNYRAVLQYRKSGIEEPENIFR